MWKSRGKLESLNAPMEERVSTEQLFRRSERLDEEEDRCEGEEEV